jgi:hypothetical protein
MTHRKTESILNESKNDLSNEKYDTFMSYKNVRKKGLTCVQI